jgi:hypothetical protein
MKGSCTELVWTPTSSKGIAVPLKSQLLAVLAGTALLTGCVGGSPASISHRSTAHSTALKSFVPAPSPAAPAPLPFDGPGHAARIATLAEVEAKIDQLTAAGPVTYGYIDLRDIAAYKVAALWRHGIDGAGTSVAVIEGWNDPRVQAVVDALDDTIGLPHAVIETVYPSGPLPAKCPPGMVKLGSYGSCDAWAGELELDVEAVHLMAPYAKIVISATPSDSESMDDASSQVAPPEMMHALQYLSQRKLANVISISDGSSETDYSRGSAEITAQDPGPLTAAAAGIPVVNATGDCGAAQNLTTAVAQCSALSSGPAVATWADSPWITAIGGTSPAHDDANSFPLDPIEGAGLSEIYSRPAFQDSVAQITGSTQRSLPDLTMDSAAGTSEAAPLFAGILALTTQQRAANLGCINQLLYGPLAAHPAQNGLVDVTTGSNRIKNIPGYAATTGFDVASGWGTVDASRFVPALATAAAQQTPGTSMAEQAAAELVKRQQTLAITPADTLSRSATIEVSSRGFLPDHPVHLSIDGRPLATVTADTAGNITYSTTATAAHLGLGRHRLTVSSMLLTQGHDLTITE